MAADTTATTGTTSGAARDAEPAAGEIAAARRARRGGGRSTDPAVGEAAPTSPASPAPAWRRWLLAVVLPLVVYTGVAGAYFKPVFVDGLTYGQVDDLQRVYFPWVGIQGWPTALTPQQDYPNSYFPRQVWLNRELRDGELPEWNPYSFAGSPFLDNGAGITFHPVRAVLAFTVPPATVHDLYLFLAMVTAGLGAHAFARRLGARAPGAFLAGTAWMLNATFLAWSQLELMASIIAGLPWVLYGIRRWYDERPPGTAGTSPRGAFRWLALAGVAAGLMPIGGSIDFTLTAWLTCGLYALVLSQRGAGWRPAIRERLRWRRLAGPVTFTVTAVAVGAPALLPFVALSSYVGREPPSESVFQEVILQRVARFLHTFSPPDLPVTGDTMHQMAFVGTIAGVLAVIGLFVRGPRSAFGRVLLVGAFLFVADTVFSRTLASAVPTYRSFTVGRHLFVWNLGVVLLASAGLDQLVGWLGRAGERLALGRPLLAVAGVLATLGIVANTYQVGTYGRDINPLFSPRDPQELMPPTDAIRALQAADGGLGGGRFLPVMYPGSAPVMAASLGMVFELESGSGYESTFLAGVEATWRTVAGEQLATVLANPMSFGYQAGFLLDQLRADLLARSGVTTLFVPPGASERPEWPAVVAATGGLERRYAGPDGEVWSLIAAPPRAEVYTEVEVVDDTDAALQQVLDPAFPWRERLVLSPEPVTGRRPEVASARGPAPGERAGGYADVLAYGNDEVRLRVWSSAGGYLLLRDSWGPGWQATVAGREVPVEVANGAFRAVPVPAGDSVVTFRYRTPGLRAGAALAGLALLALLAGAVWAFWADVVRATPRRPVSSDR